MPPQWGSRKFLIAIAAILACALKPTAAVSIAAVAASFMAAHAVADSKYAKP